MLLNLVQKGVTEMENDKRGSYYMSGGLEVSPGQEHAGVGF